MARVTYIVSILIIAATSTFLVIFNCIVISIVICIEWAGVFPTLWVHAETDRQTVRFHGPCTTYCVGSANRSWMGWCCLCTVCTKTTSNLIPTARLP